MLRLLATDSQLITYKKCNVVVGSTNVPPTVSAGPDRTIMLMDNNGSLSVTTNLGGAVSDDWPSVLSTHWSLVYGAGLYATIANPASPSSDVTFTAPGHYTLRLTANDGQYNTFTDVEVEVLRPGDFDDSGNVDGIDFLIWQRNYNHGTAASGAPILDANFSDPNYAAAQGDANGDGRVDGSDFLVWQRNYNRP